MLKKMFHSSKIFISLILLCCLNAVTAASTVYSGYSPNAALPPEIKEIQGDGTNYLVIPKDSAKYQGIIFDRILDLSNANADSTVSFTMKGPRFNYNMFIYFQNGDTIYRNFSVRKAGVKEKISLDLNLKNWRSAKPNPKLGKVKRIMIQSSDFKAPHKLELSDIKFNAPGAEKEISLLPKKDAQVFDSEGMPEDWKNIGANWFKGGPEVMNGRIDLEVSWDSLENRYSGIECKFRLTGNNPYSGYWVYFRPMDRVLTMEKQLNNKLQPEIKGNISHLNYPEKFVPKKKYKLQIEFVGRDIKVWLDGKLCFVASDSQTPFDNGTFCLAVSAGGTIHSVKIHSYDDQQKVTNLKHEYPAAPEFGDINSPNQAHWGLRTSGEPEVIFDLQDKKFVREIAISAEAVPSQNFSSVIVSASSNKKDWKSLTSIFHNRSERSKISYQMKGKINYPARYFRLTFQRSKYDNAVEVKNVDFFYSDDVAVDEEISAQKTYKRPSGLNKAVFKKNDKLNYYLTAGNLVAAISKQNGAVTGIKNNRKLQIDGSYDTYFLENREKITEASELKDKVVRVSKQNKSLVFTAANPDLPGIEIIKKYSLSSDNTRLLKRVSFINKRNDGRKDLFLTLRTNTILEPAYRKDGFYFGADWGFGGRKKASEVNFDVANLPHCPGNSKFGFFVNHASDYNIGQYLFKVNDRYVSGTITLWFEKENIPITYTAYGWKCGMATLHLQPDTETSLEYSFHSFKGKDLEFYGEYLKIPEVAALYSEFAPVEWIRDFKCAIPGSLYHNAVSNIGMFNKDGHVVSLAMGPNRWGDWVAKGVVNTSTGDMLPCDLLAKEFGLLQNRFSQAKVGTYCWAWCGMPHSNAFKQHPEWFITQTKDGKPWSAYGSGTVLNHLRHIGLQDSYRKLLSGAEEIMTEFKSDFFYLDGGNGGTNVIDWKNLRVTQIYDWDNFHTNLKRTVRKFGDDKALYFNSHSEWGYDLGLHEGIQGRFTSKLWRDSADALYVTKLKQKFEPLRKVMPLYWNDIAAQYYANYCIGMGLPISIWSGIIPRIAYVSAGYENRNLELLDGVYTPDWRFNTETVTEAYTFKNNNTKVFTVIDHNSIVVPTEITIDKKSVGLPTDKKLFIWRFTLNDIQPKLKSNYGLPEWMKTDIYEKYGFACDMAATGFFSEVTPEGDVFRKKFVFKPEIMEYIVFAEGPAAIYSVNGMPVTFMQPDSGRYSIASELTDNQIEILQTGKGEVESIVYIPAEWQGLRVENAVLKANFFQGKQQFAILKLEEGVKAVISPENSDAVREITKGGTLSLQQNADSLDITNPGNNVAVKIFSPEKRLIFVRNYSGLETISVPLPKQLADGVYQVVCDVMDDNKVESFSGSFKVAKGFRYYAPQETFIRGKHRTKKAPQVKMTPVNRVIKGKKVLNTAYESHDGYDGLAVVDVNVDKLSIKVGTNSFPPTYSGADEFSFAGFELENVKNVKLRATSNMIDVFCENELGGFPYRTVNSFGGIMVDYHTSHGYTKRVAFSLGQIDKKRSESRPRFGRAAKPDMFCMLDNLIANGRVKDYTLDLGDWAPSGWDGKVWIIIGTERASSGRQLGLEILEFSEQSSGKSKIKNLDAKPFDMNISVRKQNIAIDGKITPSEWSKAFNIKNLFALATMEDCPEKTELYFSMDSRYFYIGAILHETSRNFVTHNKDPFIWKNDALDISFGLPDGTQHQIIVDAAGQTFQSDTKNRKADGVTQKKWQLKTKTGISGRKCFIEIAVKRENALKSPKGKLKFNLARYRATDKKSVEIYTVTPISKFSLMDPELFNNLLWNTK